MNSVSITKTDKKAKTIRFIKKSNDLVEGRYRFDIWEMRVFTKMLTLIRKDDEDFKEYRIFLKEISTDFQLENKNSYKLLKDGALGLTKKEIRIIRNTNEGEKEFITSIAVGVDSFTGNGNYIDISFHPRMKPLLIQLQTQFLMYDIRNVLSIQSSFSVRIYELLKQYETIGKRKFNIEELKDILDVSDKYALYGHFKDRVILKAQKDLENYTDITFTFNEIKAGRAVTEIVFFIIKNEKIIKNRKKEIIITPDNDERNYGNTEILEIYDLIKKFPNANMSSVKNWLAKHSAEYIKQRIAFVNNLGSTGKLIRNPIGLIHSMLEQSDLFDPIEEEKKSVETLKTRKEQKEAKYEVIEKNKQEFQQKIEQQVQLIFETDKSLTTQLLVALRSERASDTKNLLIDLAHDHYMTAIDGIIPNSTEELLFNYSKGGSFAAYVLDFLKTKNLV